MSVKYVIYRGTGRDGGFGDYAGAYWDELPVADTHGNYYSFATAEEANRVAEELSDRAEKAFCAVGYHDTWSGDFPEEYEARAIPELGEDTDHVIAIDEISKAHAESWASGVRYGYDGEEDED